MAAQLTFFGTWETVTSEPVVHDPSPPSPSPPLVPVDPRQVWLLDGPHSLRLEAELACERLDVEALRGVASKAERRHPTWTGCLHWPTWAVGIEYLFGAGEPLTVDEQIDRALALQTDAARARFPEMSAAQLSRLRAAALRRSAERLVSLAAMATPTAPPQRPSAGYLLMLAGVPAEAVTVLALQSPALPAGPARARQLGYLGEALWRCGRGAEALRAYRDAFLEDALAVDEKELSYGPIQDLIDSCQELELPGEARPWLPVVADLRGTISLRGVMLEPLAEDSAARRATLLLAAYRQRQTEGLPDAERIQRKRQLLQLAPALKELLRRL